MYHYGHPPTIYHQPGVTQHTNLGREDVTLILRQQPKEALVTTNGKEKARKPVDPPPIVQIIVKPTADPSQVFLQSPYLFMCASLYKLDRNEAWDGNAAKSLAGCLTSSLHRLKDVDNKDAAFFVFGDISVKVHGTFRLHFSLFDLRKETNDVAYLGAITSEPFRVLLPKDFKGMDESTYLSRAFSDQGVRLRLRKEPRAMIGNKRSYPYSNESPSSNAPIRPNMNEYASYGEDGSSPNKRYRPATDDRKDQFADNSNVSRAAFSSSYAAPQYPDRMPSLGPNYSMPQYSAYGDITTGAAASYQFRPTSTSSYFPDPIHQTSGTNTMSGTIPTQRYPDMQQQQQPYAHVYDTIPDSFSGVSECCSLPRA